jgi:hypothetical protein
MNIEELRELAATRTREVLDKHFDFKAMGKPCWVKAEVLNSPGPTAYVVVRMKWPNWFSETDTPECQSNWSISPEESYVFKNDGILKDAMKMRIFDAAQDVFRVRVKDRGMSDKPVGVA